MRNYFEHVVAAIGVVEMRDDDPLVMGRCKVRYFGIHTQNKEDWPTDKLPWSYPMMSLDHGRNCVGPREGDWVFSIFLDGELKQRPMMVGIMGQIPELEADPAKGFFDARPDEMLEGHKVPRDPEPPVQTDTGAGTTFAERSPKSRYPDPRFLKESSVSRLARNEKIEETIVKQKKDNISIGQAGIPTAGHPAGTGSDTSSPGGDWTELETPYNAKHPYNHVYESESGHIIEVDDTPGHERLHLYHRAGTFVEIHPDGSLVAKTVNSKQEIVLKDNNLHVEAFDTKTVDWWSKEYINKDGMPGFNKDLTIGPGGNYNVTTEDGNFNITLKGDYNMYVDGVATIEVEQDMLATVHESLHVKVDKDAYVTIDGQANVHIGGDCNLQVDGSLFQRIAGDMITVVGGNKTEIIGGDKNTVAKSICNASNSHIEDIAGTIFHSAAVTNCSGVLTGFTIDSDEDVTLVGPPGPGVGGIVSVPSIIRAFDATLQQITKPTDNISIAIDSVLISSDVTADGQLAAAEGNANSPAGMAAGGGAGGGGGGGGGPKGPSVFLDGAGGGVLWKPRGENSGVVTILYPGRGGVSIHEAILEGEETVETQVTKDDGTVETVRTPKPKYKKGAKIEEAQFIKTFHGDGRGIHRLSKPPGAYPSPLILSIPGKDYLITDPNIRHD